ncbi:Transposable element P transposase [Frankliniella fusca]|uniref:Transposable element P transposase n=1 Tax=Frankliniella fusca TaxID=407009 RepID=A0AAE1HAV5_9NEOP|nr:Transposable element P transposase [Frankliniella fusca]
MKSGTAGYDAWVKYLPILPSVRCLQKNVQDVKFAPGMLHAVFDMLEVLGDVMPNSERDCQLVLDEMQLEPTPKYDSSLKTKVGHATLPTHEGNANKALLFILAGIATRWKLSVRVEFTNCKEEMYKGDRSNPTGIAYKNIIEEIILKTESVGLRNTKAMLESNGTIELPSDVVHAAGLTSPIVDYKHIEDLYEFEKDNEMKVAFRLKETTLHTKKHFKKMNVGTAKSVICHRTGVGLKLLSMEKENLSYETTAWFIILMNTFFTLATARHRGLAVSKANMGAYEEAIGLIKKVSHIFSNMKVGQGAWKPVQKGIVVLCHGYLGLIDYFLNVQKFSFLMLGRFTSDCIENIFSLVRLKQTVPNASMFLQNLKVITLAQYSMYVKGSSYDNDEGRAISNIDFLKEARNRALERARERFDESLEEIMANSMDLVRECDFQIFDDVERSVLYDIAGSVITRIKKSNGVLCDLCVSAVLWKGDNPHPDSTVTVLKEYDILREDNSNFAQICPSDEVFKAILSAEVSFLKYRDRACKLKAADMKEYFVENLMVQREKIKETERIERSSKSVAGRQAASQMV